MSLPTIIIVPGAWHVPSHYDTFISFLESRGYAVICKQNLTCGTNDASINNNHDSEAIHKLIKGVDGDVILAMHSYGGIPGAAAATGASNVLGLVFFAAFVVPEGTALVDAPEQDGVDNGVRPDVSVSLQDDWPDIDTSEFETGLVWEIRPRTTFYHDVEETVAQDAISKCQSQTFASFTTPSTATAWPHLPKIYAICSNDAMMAPVQQEAMVEQAGNWLEVKRFASGHSPWLSIAAEFNAWFENAVQALMKHQPISNGHAPETLSRNEHT